MSVAEDQLAPAEGDDGLPRVGEVDLMSRMASMARVPLCGLRGCTRAAGHDEAVRNNRIARTHAATDSNFIAWEIWTEERKK